MKINLEKYSMADLRDIATKMSIHICRDKAKLVEEISKALQEYEKYKEEKVDRYLRHQQLGNKGKEGTTYLVTDKKGREYAMKTFRKTKSSKTLELEYKLQNKAAKKGVAPKVYDYDTVSKYILMQKMDSHLFRIGNDGKIEKTKLTKPQQLRILEIFQKLDRAGIFHNDINLLNFMLKKDQIYLIDYGFAREITDKLKKKLGTSHPNYRLMTISLVIKLKSLGFSKSSYRYLLDTVGKEDKEKYGLARPENIKKPEGKVKKKKPVNKGK